MTPNKDYIIYLIKEKNWNQSQFAIRAGVSKSMVNRWLNGSRGAGNSLISGIMRAFPNEPFNKLFFL